MPSTQPIESVIIIGSGPAGYTAALYAARADLKPLLFAGFQPGGQLTITTDVENFPGFPDGIMGPELMEHFEKQARRFGARIEHRSIDRVDFSSRPFKLYSDGEEFLAASVILSTGASAKWLGIPGEQEFGGYGVSACATCDGFFFRNREVAIVGGGDTALEEAHFLTRHASKVFLIHRRETFRASRIMQDRVLNHPKVELILNTAVEAVIGETEPKKKMTGINLRNLVTGDTSHLQVDGFFVAIGHQPNSKLFEGVIDMDSVGYVKTIPGTSHTNIAGVFAAGDLADSVYRQAVTAAGTGCMAAIDAERFLSEHHATVLV